MTDRLLTDDDLAAIAARFEELINLGISGHTDARRHQELLATEMSEKDVPCLLDHIRAQDAELARVHSVLEDLKNLEATVDMLANVEALDHAINGRFDDALAEPSISPLFVDAINRLAANARLRDALAALVGSGDAPPWYWRRWDIETGDVECAYCGADAYDMPCTHAPDCPVAAARALLEGGANTPRPEFAPHCLRYGCMLMAKGHDVEEYYKDDDEDGAATPGEGGA